MVVRPQYAPRNRQRGYIIDPFRFGVFDPAFATVVQLCHFDGIDGQTGALTNSCPRGNQISTSSGAGELDTAIKVFGTAALLRISASPSAFAANSSSHADYRFGTNDWTVEMRFRVPVMPASSIQTFFDMSGGNFNSAITMYYYSDGRLVLYVNSVERIVSATGVIVAATFMDICACRVGATTRLFKNGTSVGSWADSTDYNFAGTDITMGGPNLNPPNASWDELRISNGLYGAGAGRYAANYTIATAAFPDS